MRAEAHFEFGGINHLALVCRDMARTVDFYTNVLGMPLDQDHRAPRRHGPALLLRLRRRRCPGLLLVPRRPRAGTGRLGPDRSPRPGQSDQRHRFDEPRRLRRPARAHRRVPRPAAWPPAWTAPRWPTTTTASGASPTRSIPGSSSAPIYFQDPDGILLEFACWTRPFGADDVSSPAGPGRRPRRRAEHAVPRLRQVPRAEADAPIVDRHVRLPLRATATRWPSRAPPAGSPGDWWTVFALVPDVLEHAVQGFGLYQSPKRRLAPRLRELAQARAGWAAGSQFVFSQHCKSLRALGAWTRRSSRPFPTGRRPPCFDPTERLVLAYTDCLVLDRGRVPDGLFDALRCQPRGRGDPRADLHRRALPPARGDVAGAAHRVRRPARAGRRGPRPQTRTGPSPRIGRDRRSLRRSGSRRRAAVPPKAGASQAGPGRDRGGARWSLPSRWPPPRPPASIRSRR